MPPTPPPGPPAPGRAERTEPAGLPPHRTDPEPPEAYRVVAGTGPDALVHADLALALPPDHPAGHGSMRLLLDVSGDVVVAAEPVVGMVHRGAEKLFESRDYRQTLALANRHDWLAGFASELGVALVVEEALGLEVPERAVWLRMALAELTRVSSHLAFLDSFPHEVGVPTARRRHPARETLTALFVDVSGARVHPTLVRPGGLRTQIPAGWVDRVRGAVDLVRAQLPELVAPLAGVRERLAGAGRLDREVAAGFGASGPVGRASGLDLDLRRDAPYLGYREVFGPAGPGRVVVRTAGDAPARLDCLADEVALGLELVGACLDRVRPGPVAVRLPKVVRVPEGQWYAATESPLGVAGVLLVSRGGTSPWRLALRTPSFAHVAALGEVLRGTHLSDLTAVLASVCFVMGDVDK